MIKLKKFHDEVKAFHELGRDRFVLIKLYLKELKDFIYTYIKKNTNWYIQGGRYTNIENHKTFLKKSKKVATKRKYILYLLIRRLFFIITRYLYYPHFLFLYHFIILLALLLKLFAFFISFLKPCFSSYHFQFPLPPFLAFIPCSPPPHSRSIPQRGLGTLL